ncbi:hypothetical protein FQA39_LY15954 [Lamprigera yunnana]|nr:hypothetical protein FQA39_LY15954 [Lamprigera yunnana]
MPTARTKPQPVLPTYSGDTCENINAFLNDMERHFVSYYIPKYQRLTTLAKQLQGETAKFWADYEYFVNGYDEFVQILFEEFVTPQAMADRRKAIEATPNTLQTETADTKCGLQGKSEAVIQEAKEKKTAHAETKEHITDSVVVAPNKTAAFTIDQVAKLLTMPTARTKPQPVLPTYSGDTCENINAFLNDMERHFVSYYIPKYQRLTTLAKQLQGETAKFWADYEYFVNGYDEFVQILFEEFVTPQAMADRRKAIEATPNTLQTETADTKCGLQGKSEAVIQEAKEKKTAHAETKEHITDSVVG